MGVLFSLASGGLAFAQSPSQITPRSFAPPPPAQGGEIVIPEATGPEAPAGAERLFVDVAEVDVEGGFPALREQEQAVIAEIAGKRVSAADLFAAARKLEQTYIVAGYGLVRVMLPAQRLKDGATVRLVVIDGIVERIDTSTLPDSIRGRVADMLTPLAGRHGLTMAEIERALLLAGDTPGTALRSTLMPGSQPGTTVLVIEARYAPVTGFLATDNTLAKDLGTYTTSLGLDVNSPTGHGEQVYLRAAGWPAGGPANSFTGEPRNRTLAAGVIVPLGTNGLTVNLEATDARTTPVTSSSGLGTTSVFSRVSARLNYPLMRTRDVTAHLQGAFDSEQEQVKIITPLTEELSLDRLRVLRGGGSVTWFAPGGGVVAARLTGSFGIGGRKAPSDGSAATPLSRQGADPVFQKLDMVLDYTQPVAPHLTLDLAARAQTNFNQSMVSAEQISLANATGLSPVDAGQVQGDSGFVLRDEVQFPYPTSFALPCIKSCGGNADAVAVLTPYLFGAYGIAALASPTALETAITHGTAYGFGLRLGAAPKASFSAVNASLEYGRYRLDDRLGHGQRLTFALSMQF